MAIKSFSEFCREQDVRQDVRAPERIEVVRSLLENAIQGEDVATEENIEQKLAELARNLFEQGRDTYNRLMTNPAAAMPEKLLSHQSYLNSLLIMVAIAMASRGA